MATIPTGNFGQRLADTGQTQRVLTANPVGEVAGQVIHGAQAKLAHEAEVAAAEQKQKDQQSQRAFAALTLAKTNNELHDLHDEVARGIEDGSVPTDKAAEIMRKRTGEIRDSSLSTLAPDQRMMIEDNLATTEGGLARNLVGVINKRKQSETAGFIDQFGEQVMRDGMRQGPGWASEKFDAMVDFSGGAAGWSPERQAKAKQSFKEGVHYAFYDAAGTGAMVRGDVEGIQKVRDQLSGPGGESMDPTKRTTLDHQLFGYQQSILAKQERDANRAAEDERKRFNAAVDMFNKGTDVALSGGYFSPEFIKDMTQAAEGTAMAPKVLALIGSQQKVAGFASRPAADRAAVLEAMRADRATQGVGTDPEGYSLLKAAETMDAKLRTQVQENPWAAAEGAGVINSAGQITPANPGETLAVVQTRMRDIGRVEVWAGQKVSPLQPQEVEQLGKMVRSLPVDQAATMLASLGDRVGDAERVAAVSKQIGDKDGTLGLAMMYANSKTTQGRYTAELVMRGEQAIKDKIVKPDEAKETGWRADIARQIRGAYSNRQIEDAAINAAFLIMAARTADASQSDANTDNAVRLATGGIIDHNGSKIPLPYGMDDRAFNKALGAVTTEALLPQAPGGVVFAGRVPMPLAEFTRNLQGAQLVHAGQGLYNVKTGNSVVTNSLGQRVTIKVTP